ncbi:MAG: DUF4936 family protein [Herbaspirillum sp.]
MDLYVYYQVQEIHAGPLRIHLRVLQRDLKQRYQVRSRFMRRAEATHGGQTWMEIYYDVPDDFEAELQRVVAAFRITDLIDGPRQTEHFVEI